MSRPIRILWPDDMPDERERANVRAMIDEQWGSLFTGVLADRTIERRRALCEKCDTTWWVYEVLPLAERTGSRVTVLSLSTEEQGQCPFCDMPACIAEMQAPAVREVVAAIADTPLVHELAVAADLAQQDGRTTHEQTRHPGDAALIGAELALDLALEHRDIGRIRLDAQRELGHRHRGGGIAATGDAFALTALLGHDDVAVYDASLQEWAIDPSLPMSVD